MKDKVFIAFLYRPLLVRPIFLRVPRPLGEKEGRDEAPTESPHWKTVSDLLHVLDVHKSMEPDESHQRVLKELVEIFDQTLSIINIPG